MTPPDLIDAGGNPMPERRRGKRREDDMRDDALDPAVLLGYEAWAGHVWRHRGKIAAAIGMAGSLAGCVVGYVGRAHDLDDVRARLDRVEAYQSEQQKTEALKMSMLCSLTRRIDPLSTPAECGQLPRRATRGFTPTVQVQLDATLVAPRRAGR